MLSVRTYKATYPDRPISSLTSLSKVFNLTLTELQQLESNSSSYYYVSKRIDKGNGRIRLTYDVKYPLKGVLILLRKRVFNRVSYPSYILAGRKGKSYTDNANLHLSSTLLVSEDITSFFDSIGQDQVYLLFLHFFNFSIPVAKCLSNLCCYNGALVQGSVVSGDIANLIFYDKEPAFAQKAQEQGIKYSRYYDDIYISAKSDQLDQKVGEFRTAIYGMFASVGVEPNRAKSKSMYNNGRMDVHDVTVNSHKLSPSKERVSKTRGNLHKLKRMIESDCSIAEIVKLAQSFRGQLNTLKSQCSTKHSTFQREFIEALANINEVEAKRFSRQSLRKVKTKKQLNSVASKMSILKKVNQRVKGVVEAEQKNARERVLKRLSND